VLNRIAETYLQVRRANDDSRYAKNLSIFQGQLQTIDERLVAVGRDIAQFIRQKNITSLDAAATDITQAMQDVAGRVGEAKTMYSMAVSRRQQTEEKLQGRLEPSSEDLRKAEQDPLVMGLNQTLRDMRINFDIVRQKFHPGHMEYRNAERATLAAEAERDASLKSVVQRNLTADFKDLSDQMESFAALLKKHEADYEKLQDRLKELAADKSELTQLQDQRDRLQEQRSRLLDLINDLNSLKVREDAQSVMIAQQATTPREKSFPKLQVMVPLGGLLCVVLLLGVVFVRELLDQRVRYPSDLAGIPVRLLGIVPDVADDPTGVKRVENAIREAPQSVVAESLRQIAVQVGKQLRAGGHRTVLAVGAMPESGVTSILTNIAESLASSGQRVLLVDANFRRPGLAKALGADVDRPGLGEILAGRIGFEGAPVEIAQRVHFLNVGAPSERVFERLNTAATDALLAEMKGRYDAVLVDAPPAVVAGDSMILAGKVDATLLVVRAYQEQRGLVGRLVSQLNDMPSSLVGLVLNRPRNTAGGYFRKNFETMARYADGASR
jgi:Mrp family chromosome partitioning ATPase